MDAAQSLLQKVAPADLEKNIAGLSKALKDNSDAIDALQKKHQIPFGVMTPEGKGEHPFLTCRYNRVVGGLTDQQHRSPWTNQSHPKSSKDSSNKDGDNDDDASKKSPFDEEFRLLELTYNEVWDAYKALYYGHEAVGSVYLKQGVPGDCAFQGLFGVCKKRENAGCWHSASFVTVEEPGTETCQYKIETFLVVTIEPSSSNEDTNADSTSSLTVDLSASFSKEITKECKINPNNITSSHIENIGDLIETNEMDLRSQLERVQVPKALEMVDTFMKEKAKFKPPVNPLMGMIMDSSILKKKLAK